MKITLALGLLASTLAPQQAPDAPSASPRVHGVIRTVQEGRRVPVPSAFLQLVGSGTFTWADSAGRYELSGIPPGQQRLRAIHIGYRDLEIDVHVPAGRALEVDLVLRPEAVPLPEIRVTARNPAFIDGTSDGAAVSSPATGLVSLRALEASPGLAESGLSQAVRSLPGNDPRDPSDVLLMRGSTADLKLVLLDGAPVYAPFHTGGLLQGFQLSTLGAASHHVGGAPARYDGGLSYILDLRTREARRDRIRASGSADLMSVQSQLETPLGPDAGVIATARALHGAGGHLAGGDGSPYGYVDGLVRADADLGARRGSLSITGFANREAVRLDLSASDDTPGLDEATWGNHALTGRWVGHLGSTGELSVGLATTSYRAELPVTLPPPADAEESTTPSVHVASGTTDRTRVTADLGLPGVAEGLRVGMSFDRTDVAYGTRSAGGSSSVVRSEGSVLGAYADALHSLSDEFQLRYGARLDHFDPGGARGALRLAVLWKLAPDALLTVAGGRYHQLVRLGDTEADLALGDALEVGTVPKAGSVEGLLRAATADHLTVSLDQGVTPEVRLAFEGFLKRFRGLGSPAAPELASSGADLRVVREGETLTAWLGYSLAWFWEVVEAPTDFSGRHLLSAGLRSRVLGPVEIDLRTSFSDGLPLTAVAFEEVSPGSIDSDSWVLEAETGSEVESRNVDGFLRIDAEVSARFDRVWHGRSIRIRPYLKVLNALDRRDALFYYFEPWRSDDLRPLAELSLVPIVGLEWRF